MRVLFTSHLFYDEPGYSGGSWINALIDLLSKVAQTPKSTYE